MLLANQPPFKELAQRGWGLFLEGGETLDTSGSRLGTGAQPGRGFAQVNSNLFILTVPGASRGQGGRTGTAKHQEGTSLVGVVLFTQVQTLQKIISKWHRQWGTLFSKALTAESSSRQNIFIYKRFTWDFPGRGRSTNRLMFSKAVIH